MNQPSLSPTRIQLLFAGLAVPSCVIYAIDHPLRLSSLSAVYQQTMSETGAPHWSVVGSHLEALLGASLILLAGFGAGTVCYKVLGVINGRVGGRSEPREWSIPFTVLAGLGFISLIISAAGFAGWLNPVFLWVLTIPLLLPLSWRFKSRDRCSGWRKFRTITRGRWFAVTALTILGGLILLPAIVNVLAPPHEMDELIYHLVIAKTYLRHQRILDLPYNTMSYNTRAVHMIYLLAMGLFSDVSAKLVHFGFGLIASVQVYNLATRMFCRRAGVISALIFLSHPIVIYLLGIAYVDLAVTAFFLAAVEAYLDWRESRTLTDFLRIAVMLGFVGASKLTAIFFILPFYLVLARDWFGAEPQKPLRSWLWFGAALLFPLLPWMLSSWVWTGDPFYPQLTIWLNPKSTESARYLPSISGSFGLVGMGRSFLDYLLAPWNLLVHGKQLHPHFFGALHPALLLLLAAALPLVLTRSLPRRIGFIALASLYLWTLGNQFLRYFLPGAALLTVLAGGGAASLTSASIPRRSRRVAGTITWCLILGPALLMPLYVWPRYLVNLPYITGALNRDQFLTRVLPYYSMDQYINRETPPQAVILSWFEPNTYYLDRDVIIHHPEYFDRALYEISRMDSDRQMLAWCRRNQVTYIMAHHPDLFYYRMLLGPDSREFKQVEKATSVVKSFLRQHGQKKHWNAGLWLYQIGPSGKSD